MPYLPSRAEIVVEVVEKVYKPPPLLIAITASIIATAVIAGLTYLVQKT